MAAPIGPKKVHRYTVEFKIQAVRLSLHPDIQTQDVANALDIHPFMLSKWKKDYREGHDRIGRSARCSARSSNWKQRWRRARKSGRSSASSRPWRWSTTS